MNPFCRAPAGRTAPTGLCFAGFYCAQGSPVAEPTQPLYPTTLGGLCPPGRYCLTGSTASMGLPCPPGTSST